MSVSLWAYTPEKCDGDLCRGDCDLCSKAMNHPNAAGRKKALSIFLGICPYCKKTLSDVHRSSNGETWRHCYSCHFNFHVEEKENGREGS